jgi:proteasome accessory factor C
MTIKPKLEAADRVTFLMSFVPYLIEHGPVTVSDLALHFSLEEEQVVELVRLLAMSGIPGETGVYQHEDLFDINWDLFEQENTVELWKHIGVESTPKFSAREAAALVAGLQYISGIVPDQDRTTVEKLVTKIALGASAAPENLLVTPAAVPVDLDVVRDAVRTAHSVSFVYRNSHGESATRLVDPLRLDLVGTSWYLRGWCHSRESLRTFRLDRMTELAVSSEKVRTELTASELSDELFDESVSDVTVRFALDKYALPLVQAYKPVILSSGPEDLIEVQVSFADLSAVPVFVAQIPGSITVLSPLEAKEAVRAWSQQAIDRYIA